MSAKVTIWAWSQADKIGDATTLLVLLGMADIVRDHGRYYGTQQTIADKIQMTVRTVRRSINALAEAGVVSVTPRPGRTDMIQLSLSPVTIFPNGPEEIDPWDEDGERTPDFHDKTPDNEALTPDSLSPDPGNLPKKDNPKTRADAVDLFGQEAKPPPAPSNEPPPGAFELFWREYPRKTAIGAARASFIKAWPKIPDPTVDPRSPLQPAPGFEKCLTLMRAIDAQKAGWTDPKFIPHASTWLNQERWADEVGGSPSRRPTGVDDWQ